MKFKLSIIAGLLLLFIFSLNLMADKQEKPAKHADVDWSVSCMECHQEVTPDAVKEWKSSKHGLMNFGCYMCHGDGQEEFYPQPGTERCIGCHSDYQIEPTQTTVKNCFDCHKGHTLKFHQKKD
ncbi:hypothetical protein B1H10_05230 [candidate division KSB1 bacterium 4484_188]|nr:MAG: hypothetical protein B1H10_05230 [candidate division KSB1 bacterium 4484_188]HFE63334.1 hypothetical protein [Caldithrix sp.]